jgi:hypothetical protein
MRKINFVIVCLFILVTLFSGCNQEPAGPGTLEFYVNGGDRIFVGMVSKDGWRMVFNHFYVTMANVVSYQSDPPYDPIYSAGLIRYETSAALEGTHTADIAQGGGRRLLGTVAEAPAGLYNAVSWQFTPGIEGEAAGHSIVMVGQAGKGDEIIDFTIKLNLEGAFKCGEFFEEGYDAAEKIGQLESGGTAFNEMTIAIEPIFGDGGYPENGVVNRNALGFEPFAALANNGVVEVDLVELEQKLSAEEIELLLGAIPELGKVGKGGCHLGAPTQ